MPFRTITARFRRAARRLGAAFSAFATATNQAFRFFGGWAYGKGKKLNQLALRTLGAVRNQTIRGARRSKAGIIWAAKGGLRIERTGVAYIRRYATWGVFYLAVIGAFVFGYIVWHDKLMADLFQLQKPDTQHATYYYAVNVIVLPLQTLLLLVAGLYGWWTLNQNRKFKQHDVEATCVRDYVALEERLESAKTDTAKFVAAVRAYWTLMVYEYYWWREGLISREIFAIWCEFRMQRFRGGAADIFGANAAAPFTDYTSAYRYCKDQKVFRSPSRFIDLMEYLIDRSATKSSLSWPEIERFRHGWHHRV